jgi:hypothetical protein
MITLITGLPGSFKTSWMMQRLRSLCQSEEIRPIFCVNVSGLKIDHPSLNGRVQLLESIDKWDTCPDGSIILVDELQRFWPSTTASNTPSAVLALDTHRHRGFDFFCVTQNPKLLSSKFRYFVEEHRHFMRPFGKSSANVFIFQTVEDDPVSAARLKNGNHIQESYKPAKGVHDLYISATVHTVKFRPPHKLIFALIAIPFLLFITWYGISRGFDSVRGKSKSDSSSSQQVQPLNSSSPAKGFSSPKAQQPPGAFIPLTLTETSTAPSSSIDSISAIHRKQAVSLSPWHAVESTSVLSRDIFSRDSTPWRAVFVTEISDKPECMIQTSSTEFWHSKDLELLGLTVEIKKGYDWLCIVRRGSELVEVARMTIVNSLPSLTDSKQQQDSFSAAIGLPKDPK